MAGRKAIEPGMIARVMAGIRTAFGAQAATPGGADFDGSAGTAQTGRPASVEITAPRPVDNGAWFGPLNPLTPAAPWTAGRQFDYSSGVNAVTLPREREAVSFATLRGLADGYDLLRLVIETRKDQLARCRWTIQPREAVEGKRQKKDPRTLEVESFLRRPDRDHDWAGWLRMLVEDMLVIDAACIYPRRDRAGRLWSLEIIDGTTIKRVIDETGRTPIPPLPAYQQILKGVPTADFTAAELLYLMRNPRSWRIYGYSPVEQIIMTVNIALRRQTHLLQFYTEGSVPDAVCGVPDGWSPEQIRMFQDYWDSLMTGSTAERRRVRFVPGAMGSSFRQTKEAALKDEMDEWLARIVCYAMNVSPQWAVKQMNRATSESAKQQADEEGLGPLQEWVKGVMDWVLEVCFGYSDLEFAWVEETAVDPQVQANVGILYVNAGVTCRNELRDQLGLDPVPGGDAYLITTPTGIIRLEDAGVPPPEPEPPEDPPEEPPPGGARPATPPEKPPDGKTPDLAKGAGLNQRLALSWSRWLKRAGRRAAGQAGKLQAANPLSKAAGDGVPDEPAAIDAIIADLDWQIIHGISGDLLTQAAKAGVAQGLTALQAALPAAEAGEVQAAIGSLTSLANTRAVAVADHSAADLIIKISDTTRTALRGLITRAEVEGWSVAQLAKAVKNDYAFSAERAALIAQTELAAADIQGNLVGWLAARDELGLELNKRTILGLNENHCGTCLGANLAGAIPLDEVFPDGNLAPPFHPRCACGLVAEPADITKMEGPRAPRPFDQLAKAGNPWHDASGRFTWGPEGKGGGSRGSARHLGAMPVDAIGTALGRKLLPGRVEMSARALDHHRKDHPEDIETVQRVLSGGLDKPRYVGVAKLGGDGANTVLYFPVPGGKGEHVAVAVSLDRDAGGIYRVRTAFVVDKRTVEQRAGERKILRVK